MTAQTDLYRALERSVKLLDKAGISLDKDLVSRIIHLTYEHYSRQISSAVSDLWGGKLTRDQFTSQMADLIFAQLTRAWRQGMRENGLDPDTEMLPEWQDILDGRISSEYNFVDGFADAIVAVQRDEDALQGLLARGDLWANRYNDVYNESKLITGEGTTKFEWVLGATEEHCLTCQALNGIVAFAREWEQSRFKPQDPPNDLLSCGGWRCDCSLNETTKRRSPNALDRLITIATSGRI